MYNSKLITGLSVDQPNTVMCKLGKSIYHLLWIKTSVCMNFGGDGWGDFDLYFDSSVF